MASPSNISAAFTGSKALDASPSTAILAATSSKPVNTAGLPSFSTISTSSTFSSTSPDPNAALTTTLFTTLTDVIGGGGTIPLSSTLTVTSQVPLTTASASDDVVVIYGTGSVQAQTSTFTTYGTNIVVVHEPNQIFSSIIAPTSNIVVTPTASTTSESSTNLLSSTFTASTSTSNSSPTSTPAPLPKSSTSTSSTTGATPITALVSFSDTASPFHSTTSFTPLPISQSSASSSSIINPTSTSASQTGNDNGNVDLGISSSESMSYTAPTIQPQPLGLSTTTPLTTASLLSSLSPFSNLGATVSTVNYNADTTFVSGSITLTGSAAVAAALAEETSPGNTVPGTTSGSGRLSWMAIVGIVGGILVFFILVYLIWYYWRSRRLNKYGQELKDESYDDDGNPIEKSRSDKITSLVNNKEKVYSSDKSGLGGEERFDRYTAHSGFDFSDEPRSAISGYRRRPGTTAQGLGMVSNPNVNPFESADDRYEGGDKLAESGVYRYSFDVRNDSGPGVCDNPEMTFYSSPNGQGQGQGQGSRSRPLSNPSRPETAYSKGQSFAYEDFYGSYYPAQDEYKGYDQYDDGYDDFNDGSKVEHSRPGTLHDPTMFERAETMMMMTPATSNLLPWWQNGNSSGGGKDGRGEEPPPVPSLPKAHFLKEKNQNPAQQAQLQIQRRAPPRAQMAKTPAPGAGGWQGTIPNFR